jgi:hypothetical protein
MPESIAGPEQPHPDTEPEFRSSPQMALPIAMIILAVPCGIGAWALVIFGVWPAVILLMVSAGLVALARLQIRRNKPPEMP